MTTTHVPSLLGGELPLIASDTDLVPLLRSATNEQLAPLVGYLTDDNTGRISSQLDETMAYLRHYPDHRCYVDDIAAEIQLFGGNTMANILRGHGAQYREICCDVAHRLKVNFNEAAPVETIESSILMKILEEAWNKMDPGQRTALLTALGLEHAKVPTGPFALLAIRSGLQLGGFLSYQVAVIIANRVSHMLLKRGLSLAANRLLSRSLATVAGPIGAVLMALWAAYDIAGPAYRVTIPCVIQVALIRRQFLTQHCVNGHPNAPSSRFCTECGEQLSDPNLDGFGGITQAGSTESAD